MATIKVWPAEGARVVQPDRGFTPVPPEGAEVVDNAFYRRLILTGDLLDTDPAAPVGDAAADPAPASAEPDGPDAEAAPGPVPAEPPSPPTTEPAGRKPRAKE